MPSAATDINGATAPVPAGKQSRLVVCFDGTGNVYNGDTSDTNIVKLYQKFDREHPNQYHYYQRKLMLDNARTLDLETDQ